MNVRYLLVDVDGVGSYGTAPASKIRELVGPPGPAYVGLHPELRMGAMVNDVGLLDPENFPRNVAGSVLLACLGASQQPYAGPVVFTGWDAGATWRGESEVRSLVDAHVNMLNVLLSDIRRVLGLDSGAPSTTNQGWMRNVRVFAEHVRAGPVPALTVVMGWDAMEALLRGMGGRS